MTEARYEFVSIRNEPASGVCVDVTIDADKMPGAMAALDELPWLHGRQKIDEHTWRFTTDANVSVVKIGLARFDLSSDIGVRAAAQALHTYVLEPRPVTSVAN